MDSRPPGRHGAPPHTARLRPDPTNVRLALGAGGLAALSALISAVVVPPGPIQPVSPTPPAAATTIRQRPIQYVQLAPGQTAPAGAPVIDAKAPKPITVVTLVPAPTQQTLVVRTTQSGKPVP